MIKRIPILVKIVTAYNVVQIIVMLNILIQHFDQSWISVLSIVEMLFVIATNFFLIKGKKWAWSALLIWYILITFSIEIPVFSWILTFGFQFTTSLTMTFGSISLLLGIDIISLFLLIVHYESKRHFKSSIKSKEIFDDIQIEEKSNL